VHRSLGEQRQDGCTDVATPATATAATAAASTAEAGSAKARAAEAGSAETAAEAGTEPATEASVERAVRAGILLADRIAEAPTGGAALFVDGATVDGREPEAETACMGSTLEGAVWGCEWGVHQIVSLAGKRRMRLRYVDDISETIVMQPKV
jgi:hypothetical protein